jgi:hypothetical protein
MKNRASKQLYSYWNEVRGDRLAPRRFEIEPARLASILPDAFILERLGDMDIRYRLAGTRIIEQFGNDFRGASFFDGFVLTDRKIIERQIRDMTTYGGGALFDITSIAPSGRAVTHECVLLPLIHMRDVVDRFVGCISIADAPDWLGEEPLTERTLTSYQAILSDMPTSEILPFPQPALALDNNVRTARIVRTNRRYFRVYDGGLAEDGDKT